jgi:hypothetical protein
VGGVGGVVTGGADTVALVVAVLLDVTGSTSTVLTAAVEFCVPATPAVALIATLAEAPAARLFMAQVIWVPAIVQLAPAEDTVPGVTPAAR